MALLHHKLQLQHNPSSSFLRLSVALMMERNTHYFLYRASTLTRKITRAIRNCLFFAVSLLSLAAHATKTTLPPRPPQSYATPDNPEWTLLVFIEGANDLGPFGPLTMNGLAQTGSSPKVNILTDVQLAGEKGRRYKVEQGGYTLLDEYERTIPGDMTAEFIASCGWAIENFPAQKFGVIMWSHAAGYRDFEYAPRESTPYYYNSTASYKNLDMNEHAEQEKIALHAEEQSALPHTEHTLAKRGILYDDERQIFMRNKDISTAMSYISSIYLRGKQIELVGIDACNSGMIETFWEMKPFVKYVVSSEEYEIAQGWPYDTIAEKLVQNPTMTGKELGKVIVDGYGAYYQARTHHYTQSCIDVGKLDDLNNALNEMIAAYARCKEFDPTTLPLILRRARLQTLSFIFPYYVDLGSFCKEFGSLIDKNGLIFKGPASHIARLKESLNATIRAIQSTVTANTTGFYLSRAMGISIYFPTRERDSKYELTRFGQESLWPRFIYEY